MDNSPNPAGAALGFFLLLQIIAFLVLFLGGVYVLFCLSRAAAALDRIATVAETWFNQQQDVLAAQSRVGYATMPVPPTPPTPPTPPVPPTPTTPSVTVTPSSAVAPPTAPPESLS